MFKLPDQFVLAPVQDTLGFKEFLHAYVEAALWSTADEGDNHKRAATEVGYILESVQRDGVWKHHWIKFQYPLKTPRESPWLAYASEVWDNAWADMGGGSNDTALEANYSIRDVAPEAAAQIVADCWKFYRNGDRIPHYEDRKPDWTDAQYAGHDFFLSRNGHGAGFFDRGLGDLGDRLQKAAHKFGNSNPYVGDDGKIYVA